MEEKKAAGKKQLAVIGAVVAAVAAIIIGMAVYQKSPAQQVPKLLDLGQKYLLDEDYEQAIAKFDEVLAIDPKNINAYMGKAEAYIGMEEYDSAIEMYEEIIAINPAYEDAYLKNADVHITTTEYANALDVLSRGYDATQSTVIQAKMKEVESLIAEQEKAEKETAGKVFDSKKTEEAKSEDRGREDDESDEKETTLENKTKEEKTETGEGEKEDSVSDKPEGVAKKETAAETQQEEPLAEVNTQTNEAVPLSDYATEDVKSNRKYILNYIPNPNNTLEPWAVDGSWISNGTWNVKASALANEYGDPYGWMQITIQEVYESHNGNMVFMGYRYDFKNMGSDSEGISGWSFSSEAETGRKYLGLEEVLEIFSST